MRRLILAAAMLFATLAPAMANCLPVQADTFVLQGVASIESGETKGTAIVGPRAVAFTKVAELPPTIVALFFIGDIDSPDVMVIVVVEAPGGDMACVGEPNQTVKDAFRKYIGRGA